MNQEHTFTIEWAIQDEQWVKAGVALEKYGRGSAYDRNAVARYHLLYGDVDFAYDDVHLYGSTYGAKGINVSLLDLAVALAEAYLNQRFLSGATATYEQLDDDLRIRFAGEDDVIRVIASDRPAEFVVSRAAFMPGVLAFLCSVGSTIKSRLGGAMEWESMAPLREVMVRFCGN